MVQKKVPSKLGIQADHVKSEKLLGNLKKQASCQHQDGKSRGPEMKKKMKRSRSIKLSDIESLKSTPLRKRAQPGKPPPLSSTPVSAPAALQRQSLIGTTDGSPNYMKATSSSEARKERSPVSSSASDSKNLRRRNSSSSKIGSCSGNKPIKSLTKSSSLKLMRTLTKSPSFKPVRGTAKKCSRVALCAADMDVQRATCSSTLKDSNFPEYLMLNPGGTEAEGTSVTKVCPYTYCSLNGHHHTPLPPLKCFLKAKRRSLKAQKSVTLEALSPRKSKLFDDGAEEIDRELMGITDNKKLPNVEMESAGLVKVPQINEVAMDFFVEIYAKDLENRTEKTKEGEHEEPEEQHESFSCNGAEALCEQDNEKQVEDEGSFNGPFDASLYSGIDSEEKFEESNIDSVDMDVAGEFNAEQQQVEDSDAEEPTGLPEEGENIGSSDNGSDHEGKCHLSLKDYDGFSEVTDMEWEDDRFSASEDDKEYADLYRHDDDSPTKEEFESNIKKLDSLDTDENFESDDMVSNCTEEILVDVVLKELFEEETGSFNTECYDSELETEGMTESSDILESNQNDQPCSMGDASNEEISTEEDNKVAGTYLINIAMMLDSTEEPILESTGVSGNVETQNGFGKSNPQLEDAENDCTIDMSTKILNDHQEERCLRNHTVDPSQENPVNKITIKIDGDFEDNQKLEGSACELDDTDEDGHSLQNIVGGSNSKEPFNDPVKEEHDEANKLIIHTSRESEEQSDTMIYLSSSGGNDTAEVDNMEEEVFTKSDAAETFRATDNGTKATSKSTFRYSRGNGNHEVPDTCSNRKLIIGCKKPIIKDTEQERKFNPKEPNFLPVIPDPEAEKVDLKHQIMDDKKNAEEWMLDHALQQAVSKLAPARKRKVALLVEAFETVLPTPKWETQTRRTSNTFSHTRQIQACS